MPQACVKIAPSLLPPESDVGPGEALARAGFDPSLPTLVIAEGLMMYLDTASVEVSILDRTKPLRHRPIAHPYFK